MRGKKAFVEDHIAFKKIIVDLRCLLETGGAISSPGLSIIARERTKQIDFSRDSHNQFLIARNISLNVF